MPAHTSLRIAIAEDEFLVAEDLRQLVEGSGHKVVGVVATAPEFVSLVERRRPDLALVDVQLARGTNGLDAAKAIKQQYGLPAIAVTSNPDEQRARKAGLLGLVPKPCASAALGEVLRAWSGPRFERTGGIARGPDCRKRRGTRPASSRSHQPKNAAILLRSKARD